MLPSHCHRLERSRNIERESEKERASENLSFFPIKCPVFSLNVCGRRCRVPISHFISRACHAPWATAPLQSISISPLSSSSVHLYPGLSSLRQARRASGGLLSTLLAGVITVRYGRKGRGETQGTESLLQMGINPRPPPSPFTHLILSSVHTTSLCDRPMQKCTLNLQTLGNSIVDLHIET